MSDSLTPPSESILYDGPGDRAVMTYNLKNGTNILRWLRRRKALFRVIQREKPLLLGTQEGYRYQLNDIRRALSGYDYVGVGRYASGGNEFNAIFYDTTRVEMLASSTFWLSRTPDVAGSKLPGSAFPRIVSWAHCRLRDDEHEVLFVNTHLTHQSHDIEEQTAILIQELQRLIDPTMDTILTGDFNQARHTPTWRALQQIGFVDAWEFADDVEGPVFTFADWDHWDEERAASVTKENRIDWIMYRPGEGRSLPHDVVIRTINTHANDVAPSDHFPVVLKKSS